MRLMTCLAVVFVVGTLVAAPPRIIFDTDMCFDYDDVGALAILHALADAGECEIIGIVSSTRHSPALGMCELINAHYGRTNLLMGVCREMGVSAKKEKNGITQVYQALVEERKKTLTYPNTNGAADANAVYRRLLMDSPDGSVVICTVGFLTNVRRLLETPGDAVSPLTGCELVARKVKAWYAMAGILPKGAEFNVREEPESAAKAIANCPVPLYFIDFNLGVDVLTGLPVSRQGVSAGIVAEAYLRSMNVWGERNRGRSSWDLLAVLAAVRDYESHFGVERGTMHVDPRSGFNTWTKAETGPHFVLLEKTPKAKLRDILDELLTRPPRR